MTTSIPTRIPSAQEQNIDALYGQSSSNLTAWHRACALAADQLSQQAEQSLDSSFHSKLAKGLALAQSGHVALIDGIDLDESGDFASVQSGKMTYAISTEGACTCPDHTKSGKFCKHLLAVEIYREALPLLLGQQTVTPLQEPPNTSKTPVSEPDHTETPQAEKVQAEPLRVSRVSVDNPAGANFKARVGNAEIWYTWHGATDAEVTGRMRETLPFLQEIVEACEDRHAKREEAARQRAQVKAQAQAEDQRMAQAEDQRIAQAVAAALAAQANGKSPQPLHAEAQHQATTREQHLDDSWCARHQVEMKWHPANENGQGWWSHLNGKSETGKQLYCKGK